MGIVARLHQQQPSLEINVEQIHTKGDAITNIPLSQFGGDGVFVTEIERALSSGRIDLAVHSLKDLPTEQPDGLFVNVVGPREDVRDVLVSNHQPQISADGRLVFPESVGTPRIGTCSLRRTAQLRTMLPEVDILSLRGNVDTRLRKLEAGEYDAIVLAAAGLHRLDMQERLEGRLTYLPLDLMLPAPGQGALGLEMRDEPELRALVDPLCDETTFALASAERLFMRRLGAGCYLPVAAHGTLEDGIFSLRGLVISLDGTRQVRVQKSVPWTPGTEIKQAVLLGIAVAEMALDQGASEIISAMSDFRIQERERV
jgi:hydroxymethylbilane synthase